MRRYGKNIRGAEAGERGGKSEVDKEGPVDEEDRPAKKSHNDSRARPVVSRVRGKGRPRPQPARNGDKRTERSGKNRHTPSDRKLDCVYFTFTHHLNVQKRRVTNKTKARAKIARKIPEDPLLVGLQTFDVKTRGK